MVRTRPHPCLLFDPGRLRLSEPDRDFFRRKTVTVAQDLVGAWIARRWRGRWYGARIVETEAYLGPGDAAAHSWKGRRTARVEPMYLDGGHLYVFFVYGMHCCANVVTRRPEDPQAVLLRAAEAPACPPKLLSGPGKLCAALGIAVADSGSDLLGNGDIRVYRDRGRRRPRLVVTPRIGVDYAGEAARWPLRFFDADSAAVSGPRIRAAVENRTRRPQNHGR